MSFPILDLDHTLDHDPFPLLKNDQDYGQDHDNDNEDTFYIILSNATIRLLTSSVVL